MPGRPFVKGEKVPTRTGIPNRVSVELRTLFGQLVNDPEYQRKFREDFRARRVHPITETKVWEYHAGKPPTELNIHVTKRYEAESELLRSLSLPELEALAEESQALIDRALERSKRRELPQDIVVSPLDGKVDAESLGKDRGSDNRYSVNSDQNPDNTDVSADD